MKCHVCLCQGCCVRNTNMCVCVSLGVRDNNNPSPGYPSAWNIDASAARLPTAAAGYKDTSSASQRSSSELLTSQKPQLPFSVQIRCIQVLYISFFSLHLSQQPITHTFTDKKKQSKVRTRSLNQEEMSPEDWAPSLTEEVHLPFVPCPLHWFCSVAAVGFHSSFCFVLFCSFLDCLVLWF